MSTRCVNIDWLEVHCFEPIEHALDADFYRVKGWFVREREYGTRVYKQMFTLVDDRGEPCIEIRRDPKSTGVKGIHQINECHIRLVNRACYLDDAAEYLHKFIITYGYEFRRISRIDICYDFIRFDSGDYPSKFLRRYINKKYAKINQSRITVHGDDNWEDRDWNSVSWGSKVSAISTKMYNKTKELQEVSDKPYIRYSWYRAGLVDDPINLTTTDKDGQIIKPDIWRIEFSIKSAVRGWYDIYPEGDVKGHHSFRNTLDVYDNREKLWHVFQSLQEHYFHFRKYEPGKTKYRCERKVLFNTDNPSTFYHVDRLPSADSTHEKSLRALRLKLEKYLSQTVDSERRHLASELVRLLIDDEVREFGTNVFTKDEVLALQLALQSKQKGVDVQAIREHVAEIQDLFTGEIW